VAPHEMSPGSEQTRPAISPACADTARTASAFAPSPTRRLTRDVAGVTAIKVILLAIIYALFYWGTSHRLPLDTAAHIAGIPPNSETR
jgi:hypothetical protein